MMCIAPDSLRSYMQRNSASNLLFRGNKGVLYVSLRPPKIDDPLLTGMVILWSNEPPMVFQLKHFGTMLMELAATEASDIPDVEILWINEKDKSLLPLDMEISEEGVAKWLKSRTIPKNRAYVHFFLQSASKEAEIDGKANSVLSIGPLLYIISLFIDVYNSGHLPSQGRQTKIPRSDDRGIRLFMGDQYSTTPS